MTRQRLHFECHSGVSGDMLLGALIDLGCPLERLNDTISALGIDGLTLARRVVSKSGIRAVKCDVVINSEKKLKHWTEVRDILESAELSDFVRSTSLAAMEKIASAESKTHQTSLEKVHFHELGSLDTIADVVGVASAVEFFDPVEITVSPIAVGSGVVNIDHGTVPVPAPATLDILQGMELDCSELLGERATPTGAALVATLVGGNPPAGTIARSLGCGYGAGSADFKDRVNVLRAQLFERHDNLSESDSESDVVCQLDTTIDDMNPQIFGHVIERLYAAGALEAYTTACQMKKGRPGATLTVICHPTAANRLAEIILNETTTGGIRLSRLTRLKAPRRIFTVDTEYGAVSVKAFTSRAGERFQPEYEDCARLARSSGLPLREIFLAVERTLQSSVCANEDSSL